jgi:hypothetical protein
VATAAVLALLGLIGPDSPGGKLLAGGLLGGLSYGVLRVFPGGAPFFILLSAAAIVAAVIPKTVRYRRRLARARALTPGAPAGLVEIGGKGTPSSRRSGARTGGWCGSQAGARPASQRPCCGCSG